MTFSGWETSLIGGILSTRRLASVSFWPRSTMRIGLFHVSATRCSLVLPPQRADSQLSAHSMAIVLLESSRREVMSQFEILAQANFAAGSAISGVSRSNPVLSISVRPRTHDRYGEKYKYRPRAKSSPIINTVAALTRSLMPPRSLLHGPRLLAAGTIASILARFFQ